MKPASKFRCEVCGRDQNREGWFLVREDRNRDTLQILKWNSRLAEEPEIRHLCSAAHVEELVSRWMLTGSLDYGCFRLADTSQPAARAHHVDESYRLGELTLDRASFAALGERPDMLNSILEAIDGALQTVDADSLLPEEEDA